MERRCIICGEQPTSAFTYPHNLEQALKWQNMLATFVPLETLMHNCCVCNKHVHRKKATVTEPPYHDEERFVTFTDANAIHYFTDQRLETTRTDCAQTDNFCKPQNYYKSYNDEQPSDEYEQVGFRSTSGSDLNFRSKKQAVHKNANSNSNQIPSKGASSKRACRAEADRCSSLKGAMAKQRENFTDKLGRKSQLDLNSSSFGYPLKTCNKQVCPKQQQQQQKQQQNCPGLLRCSNQNINQPHFSDRSCMCDRGQMNARSLGMGKAPCRSCSLMDTGRRPPVNVLIMGGSNVPSYYNDKALRKQSSDISQICVLESDMTDERAFFPDIDEPNYSVCRQPAENGKNESADSTDVLLLGTAPEKKCPCAEAASAANATTKLLSAHPTQQPEKRNSDTIDKKGTTQLDELESLVAQQQQLQKSIQEKLSELLAKTNIEKERVNAGNSPAHFSWPAFERLPPRVRVLSSMANYKTNY